MPPLDPITAQAAKAKQVAFEKAVQGALLKYEKATEYQLDRVTQQLKEYRQAVLATVAQTDWQKARLEELDRALLEAQQTVAQKLAQSWKWQADSITSMALDSVDGPLGILGLNTSALPVHLPVQQLVVINNYVPSQIVNVTADVHEKVRGLMRRAVLGGLPGQDLVKAVGDVVGPLKPGVPRPAGTVFSAADVRARTIMRTEMNRLHNLVKTSRVDEVAEKYPGVGYKWLHRRSNFPRDNHTALAGTIIFPGLGEKFALAGLKVAGPHDPALPAEEVINCHCTAVVVYDNTKGAAEVNDSPYIAGDGKQIPSAGIEAPPAPPAPPPPPPGPRTTFLPDAAGDAMIQAAHKAGVTAWEGVADKAAAQAAYDKAYADAVMEAAKKEAAAAEHALKGVDAKIAYHQAKVTAFEKAGLKSYLETEKPKLAGYVGEKTKQQVATIKPKLEQLVADADKVGFGSPGNPFHDDMVRAYKALKSGTPEDLLDPGFQAMVKNLETKVAAEMKDYAAAQAIGEKASWTSKKLADYLQHHADVLNEMDPALVKFVESETKNITNGTDYTNFKLFQINGAKHYKEFTDAADDLVAKMEKGILKAQQAKAAAAQAAEDALTAPKIWAKADLDELVAKPAYKMAVGQMNPAQKVGFYEAKLAKAEKDLERAVGRGWSEVYLRPIREELAKCQKLVAGAREDLVWFASALDGVKVTPQEMQHLLKMKRTEVKAWVKLKKLGKAPSLLPDLGPELAAGADWSALEARAAVNFWHDPSGETEAAMKWWKSQAGWYKKASALALNGWKHYTGSVYTAMNKWLRSGAAIDPTYRRWAEAMRDCWGKGILWRAPENMILRRGITETTAHFEDFIKVNVGNLEKCVGTIIEDKAFCSTSVGGTNSLLHKTFRCEIFVPKGAELAIMSDISELKYKLEIVLPPGSKFRVVRARKVNNLTILSLEYLP